eukprot:CAMPEP_0167761290 /NCGR_PEP_ID=MMETSP0110_2-20121227/12085_1 /TAXON_ID=629695 /ORGANISM="Gymnochlora sp., Strain CCMP2014" /LENGTH=57 /DNA_ID=CAMNT_0007647947 /DNA_START=1290 /DNA_END=1463 /DNA_ORIENTATION=+
MLMCMILETSGRSPLAQDSVELEGSEVAEREVLVYSPHLTKAAKHTRSKQIIDDEEV